MKKVAEIVVDFLTDWLPGLLPKPADSVVKAILKPLGEKVTLLFGQPATHEALLEAARKAEEDFIARAPSELDDDLLCQAVVSLPLHNGEEFQAILRGLTDHLDEQWLVRELHAGLLKYWEGKFAEDQIRKGLNLYLTCLQVRLLGVEGFREIVTGLAAVRSARNTEILLEKVNGLIALVMRLIEREASTSFRALHQLPSPPADFTGREEGLKQLLAGLSAGRAAAISGLTGLGGIGKTALGLVVAHKLAGQFPDAQIFLDLKGTTTPLTPADLMRHAILSFEPTADLRQADETQLAALYQSVLNGRKVLLFLDNARSAEQVRPLLPPETCGALVTSRWNISLPGLHPLRLDVLPEAEAIQFLLTLCARIGDVAAEIAKLCGYLPLALRIAGTFLAVHEDWSPEEYASRLSDRRERLKALKTPDDPTLDLEATFELSYQQLGEGEQKYWRMLAVFPASFRREAAAAVWALEESLARELLSKLHRMSLLDYLEPSPPEGGRGQACTERSRSGEGGGRFSLHDLLADFALARMSKEENFDSHLRHAQYYMNVMGQADALYLKGGESILQGLKSFDAEWAHIQAGQAWAAENTKKGSETSELAMLYPDAGTYCLDLRLTPQQRIGWLMAALEAAQTHGNKSMEGNHLGNLGLAYAALGDARKAIQFYEQQLVIAREIGDRRGEGVDLGNLGSAYAALGDARKAIQFYEQCLTLHREIGDRRGEGAALGNLGNAYADLGDARKAIQFYEQHLEIAREIGDRRGEALGSWNLGLASEKLGDVAKAIKAMQVCVDFEREIGHPDAEKDAAKVADLKQKL